MSRLYVSAAFVPTGPLRQRRRSPACAMARAPGRRLGARRPTAVDHPPDVENIVPDLLYFDSRAGIFKLFFDLCRLFLVDTFLDRLRRRLDEILGFLETQDGDSTNLLDDIDFFLADRREDHVELGLLDGRLG